MGFQTVINVSNDFWHTFEKADLEAGHGYKWKAEARRLGGSANTTHDVKTDEIAPFMFDCPCGNVHKAYKRSKNLHYKVCKVTREKIVWVSGAEYRRAKAQAVAASKV